MISPLRLCKGYIICILYKLFNSVNEADFILQVLERNQIMVLKRLSNGLKGNILMVLWTSDENGRDWVG